MESITASKDFTLSQEVSGQRLIDAVKSAIEKLAQRGTYTSFLKEANENGIGFKIGRRSEDGSQDFVVFDPYNQSFFIDPDEEYLFVRLVYRNLGGLKQMSRFYEDDVNRELEKFGVALLAELAA